MHPALEPSRLPSLILERQARAGEPLLLRLGWASKQTFAEWGVDGT